MKQFRNLKFVVIACLSFTLCTSCDRDDEIEPTYEIPTAYNFTNVSYSGQTQRLAMLGELRSALDQALDGSTVDASALKAMYANDDATWTGIYDASKQLKSKTFEQEQGTIEAILDAHAAASQSNVPGSNGQAGLVSSSDNSNTYLLGATGLDHVQLIEKGLMGACFYYQANAVYFGDDKMNADNERIVEGEGTKMEHHWDEAFGYLGVPIDFPTNTDGLYYWGKYSNSRNALIECNDIIMNAFLKGRAAISNKDLTARDEAISSIRQEWELVAVGSALHYINECLGTAFDDMALRGHKLSEVIGFVKALQYNPEKKITNAEVTEILTWIAGSSTFEQMNLYTTTIENLQLAKEKLVTIYDLEATKDQF